MADEANRSSSAHKPLLDRPISPGVALGPARLLDRAGEASQGSHAGVHIEPGRLASERQHLQDTLTVAEAELDGLHTRVASTVGQAEAEIFTAQKLMLRDPDLLDAVDALMTGQLFSTASALQIAIAEQSALLASLPDATLAARAADVRDIGARVLSHLQSSTGDAASVRASQSHQEPALIIARDLTPSQTARLDPASILGICTVEGGPTTHAAIIARALEIPAVAGLDARVLAELREGQQLAIDGGGGLG